MDKCSCGNQIIPIQKDMSKLLMCPDCYLRYRFKLSVAQYKRGEINIQQLRKREWKDASHMQRYLRYIKYRGNSLMCRYIWRAEQKSPNNFFSSRDISRAIRTVEEYRKNLITMPAVELVNKMLDRIQAAGIGGNICGSGNTTSNRVCDRHD